MDFQFTVNTVGMIVALAAMVYAGFFIRCFTQPLEPLDRSEDIPVIPDKTQGTLKSIFRHAYALTLATLVLPLIVVIVLVQLPRLTDVLAQSPIGLLKACQAVSADPQFMSCVRDKDEKIINTGGAQWVFNVGGSVLTNTDLRLSKRALESALAGANNGLKSLEAAPDPTEFEASKFKATIEGIGNSVESALKLSEAPRYLISGGLVMPFYFIVLSIMGATVNLMRRLPEYQNRGSQAYLNDFYQRANGADPLTDPPMSPSEVREFVVFQIMQVFSAPLIATAAYALVDPSRVMSVVVLGFASGFASQAVLIRLRQALDVVGGSKGSNKDGGAASSDVLKTPKSEEETMQDKIRTALGAVAPRGSGR